MPTPTVRRLLDGQEPVIGTQLQEWRPGGAVARLEDLLGDDLAEVPMIPLVLHLVGGQWVISSLNRDVLVGDPDAGGLPGQAALAIEAPVAEADIPLLIDPTAGQQRREDPRQL